VGDDGKALNWGEFVIEGLSNVPLSVKHGVFGIHGANLYRSGRFCEAIERINEGIAAANGQINFEDAAFLAMAYHQCGDSDKAHAMLAKLGVPESSVNPEDYWTITAHNVLRREAQRLILDHRFPENPFSH
jgi:hypothetical protein